MLKAISLFIFITQVTYASPLIRMNEIDGIVLKSGEFIRTINQNEFKLFIKKIKLNESENSIKLNAHEFESVYLKQGNTIDSFNTVSAATAGGDMGGGGKVITIEK